MIEVSWQFFLTLLLACGGVLAIAYISAGFYLYLRQTYFIFKPPIVIRTTPAAFDLEYEEIRLPVETASGDISFIQGWWVPAAQPEAPVWLYLHGNGSTIGDEVKRAFWFHRLGYSSLLIDYRGYGRSRGKFPTESSVYEDVEASFRYLTQVKQIPAERIFLYGYSLGGAIAIDLALQHSEIAGVAVEGSFTSMRAMVEHLYNHFLIFPVDLILNQRFDSLSKVRSLSMPLLFIHGTRDRLVPAHMSQTLFDTASEPKQLLLVPEAGHHDVGELGGAKYFQAIQWLVEQAHVRQESLAQP
ncbi:MAG TPA: phospholipase [Cyanobacteria bacterium UBA8543]|nr:phospholipase [Cyanobacteria bacterium UBA8543]